MRDRTKKGGRPRQYDPDAALDAATRLLWHKGLSSSSLDEIAHSAKMNRPSLNAAFGDKREIYLKAARRFGEALEARMAEALAAPHLLDALKAALLAALKTYTPEDEPHGGCFVLCTAPAEVHDPAIRGLLEQAIARIDALFVSRLETARDEAELPQDCPVGPLGQLLAASLHSMALRARAGASEEALESYVQGVVRVMQTLVSTGSSPATSRSHRGRPG